MTRTVEQIILEIERLKKEPFYVRSDSDKHHFNGMMSTLNYLLDWIKKGEDE